MLPPFVGGQQTGLGPAWQERRLEAQASQARLPQPCLAQPAGCCCGFQIYTQDSTIRPAPAAREEALRMAEKLVGKISEFKDGDRRIVFVGDHEIGVFREHGTFYAYSNYCLHQGGPACEGLTIAKVEERLMPDKTSKGLYFSDTELHFVCPWHGYEYDMKTGECVSDRKLKLRKYEVIQKGDEVYVRA
jgi:nitrite reductase/ring-hydroxylating ferredoxin subunit